MLFLRSICETSAILKVIYFITKLLKIIFIIVPIGLILMVSLDFGKNVIADKIDDMQKNFKIALKRIMMLIGMFLVPSLVSFLVTFMGKFGVPYTECLKNASLEQIAIYESEEKNENSNYYSTTNSSNETINSNNNIENEPNTVNTKQVTKITLNKTQAAIGDRSNVESLGKKYQNNYVKLEIISVTPSDAKEKGVVWSIVKGKQNIKINQNGEVYGLNGGTAVVRATSKDNPNVYAECKITIVHSLYINAKLISNVTATIKYSNDQISLKKGEEVVVLGYFRHKTNSNYKNLTYTARLSNGTLVELKGKYMKFYSYYIDNGYENSIYEDYINNNGFTSKTEYLIWVNQGTQRLLLFKNQNGKWKIVENFKTSTGDVEGKNTGDRGGATTVKFDLEVRDFKTESDKPYIGRAIHVQEEKTKKYFGNTMHVGSLPSNAAGGNSSENQPSSHGCPHLSVNFRNKLYNTYNQKNQNKLIGSKVIYY